MPLTEPERIRPETVFRTRWRDHHSARVRTGELIEQPGWIDTALVALAALLVGGAVAGTTVTVERTASLPAVVSGSQVTAIRGGAEAPATGTAVQYRDSSGTTVDAVVVEVTPSEVIAQLARPGAPSAGDLVLPAGRQPVMTVLLPRLG